MKRNYRIVINLRINYPYLDKFTKQLEKDFNCWLKETIDRNCAPVLYEHRYDGVVEHVPKATMKIQIKQEKNDKRRNFKTKQGYS